MKKKLKAIVIIGLMLGMVGCAGLGDYEADLINGFKLIRTSSKHVNIGSDEYSYDEVSIPILADYEEDEYVTEVGHDKKRYIIAKTDLDKYYLLDTKDVKVYGPFDEEKFNNIKEKAGISKNVILRKVEELKKNK